MLIALESTGLHFYPRPPRGGRPKDEDALGFPKTFLSTPSARRATRGHRRGRRASDISIHALREEGDSWRWALRM